MAYQTRIHHPGRPGTWPHGEPESVRDAYDRLLADQAASAPQTSSKATATEQKATG